MCAAGVGVLREMHTCWQSVDAFDAEAAAADADAPRRPCWHCSTLAPRAQAEMMGRKGAHAHAHVHARTLLNGPAPWPPVPLTLAFPGNGWLAGRNRELAFSSLVGPVAPQGNPLFAAFWNKVRCSSGKAALFLNFPPAQLRSCLL